MGELRFECQKGCTKCCELDGHIYLTEEDVQKAAAYLNLTPKAFETRYIYRTRNFRRIRKAEGGRCPFLDNGCTIHPAKPTQCRLFPFWPEIVGRPGRWAATSRYCPGIGKGPLIQIRDAREIAAEMKTAYPTMYR